MRGTAFADAKTATTTTTVAFLRKHLLGKDDATQVPPKE